MKKNQVQKSVKSKPIPAYFLSLTIENARCFKQKQTLDLSDGSGHPAQWTVILGNNGTGKTTLLQCLAVFNPGLSTFNKLELFQRNNDENCSILIRKLNIDKKNIDFMSLPNHSILQNNVLPGIICYDYGATRRMGKIPLSDISDVGCTYSLFDDDVVYPMFRQF